MSVALRAIRARVSLGLAGALALALVVPASLVAAPPPGMPDPSQMHGIPRPEPNLTPGTVMVRCLDGSFANPAVGVEVELEISTAAGPKAKQATTVAEGRALFTGLDEYFGHQVVAKASFAGQELRSQSFVLGPQAGIALLLVAGGSNAATPAPPPAPGGDPHAGPGAQGADPHGGQGVIPDFGTPFPLADRPRGTLIVGTLDFDSSEPSGIGTMAGVEVTLIATVPGAGPDQEPIREVLTTNDEGRATFVELDQRLSEGAEIVVEAVLEDGAEPKRSIAFGLADTAQAVILTRGEPPVTPPPPPPQQQPGPRVELPGPRVDRSVGPGEVRVMIIDAHDQPVADQLVVVHSSESTGDSGNRSGRTDAQGMVVIEGVPYETEMLSQVRVVYEGAPYSSTLFEMPDDTGAIVMLRVFRPTGDRTRVRSALQLDVSPRENDFAAVTFNYAVFVDGDEAFWIPGGMTLYGPTNTRSLHVLEDSKSWLMHDGETPWVQLDRPLEPGVELRLSFAVGLDHDGTLEIEWSTPFPLVEDGSMVTVPAELAVTRGVGGIPEVDPHAGRDGTPIELYKLGPQPFELGVCDTLAQLQRRCPLAYWSGNDISVVVEGLPTRSPVPRYTAWGLLGLAGLGVVISMLVRRRVSPREALLARRDALIAELVALDEAGVDTPAQRQKRTRMVATLDRIYRQLEALA